MLQRKVISLILCFYAIVGGTYGADKYTDENRPYEFGFTIEGEQHRHEKKDENGIIMGEFGFITADGVYHVTVYATDENGAFKILSMKNIRVKPYPTAGVKKGHSLPFPPSQNAPVLQGPSSIKTQEESKSEPAKKPVGSPAKACSHCSVPTTTTVAPKLTDLAVVSKDRAPISSSQSIYQQNNPLSNSGVQGFRQQETNFAQNSLNSGLGQQNGPYSPFSQNDPNSQLPRLQNNNRQSTISGSSYLENGDISNDPQPNSPNFNSPQTNKDYKLENGRNQYNQNENNDYQNQNYPQGPNFNSQQAINNSPKDYQQNNNANEFNQNENQGFGNQNHPQGQHNFNQNLQPKQNINQGFGNQNYNQGQDNYNRNLQSKPNINQGFGNQNYNEGQDNYNRNLQPEENINQGFGNENYNQGQDNYNLNVQSEQNSNEKNPQGISNTYAPQGKQFRQSQPVPGFPNIPSSNSETGAVNSQTPQGNLRNPKQYNNIPSTNGGIGQPNGFRDILESQNYPPVANKPTLVAAQMQIVPKDTDIYYKRPGEKDGLPEGLSKNDMTRLLYTFNYTVGFHGHHEEGYTNGAKQGYYYVTGRNGVRTRVDYVADENGFRPTISQEVLDLLSDDVPKPETEREERFGLKGYEFKWLYFPAEETRQQ